MGYQKEILIYADIDKVWNSWTSEEETTNWLASRARVVFEEKKPYEFFWDDDPEKDSTIGCRLLAIDIRKRLSFEWQGKTEFLDMFCEPYEKTVIDVFFVENENFVKVKVIQEETRDLLKWKEYDEWMSDAWAYALSCLKKYCEGNGKKKDTKKDCC